jgi:hypothetical protein
VSDPRFIRKRLHYRFALGGRRIEHNAIGRQYAFDDEPRERRIGDEKNGPGCDLEGSLAALFHINGFYCAQGGAQYIKLNEDEQRSQY